jgi:hypothetical protein
MREKNTERERERDLEAKYTEPVLGVHNKGVDFGSSQSSN